jgi:hypothetical protein
VNKVGKIMPTIKRRKILSICKMKRITTKIRDKSITPRGTSTLLGVLLNFDLSYLFGKYLQGNIFNLGS